MALNYILLEDGSGHILLEDGSGSILLENQPASSSIVFTVTGNALKGTARTSMSSSIVFTPTGHALRGTARTSMSSSIVFTSTASLRAYARTLGSSSIIFTVTGHSLRGTGVLKGTTSLLFTVLGELCFTTRPFDPVTGISTSPILSNTTGLGNLPAQVSTVVPPPPYSINTGSYFTLFGTSTYVSPDPPFPENQDHC